MNNALIVVILILIFAALSGITGIGGGGFYGPILLFVGLMAAKQAVPLSKAVTLGVACGAVLWNVKRKNILYKSVFVLEVPTLIGTIIGVQLNIHLPEIFILLLLGITVALSGLKTLSTAWKKRQDSCAGQEDTSYEFSESEQNPSSSMEENGIENENQRIWYILGCVIAGILSGSVGIGGGKLKVPLLIELGVPMNMASGTGNLMVLLTSTSTVFQFLLFQRIEPFAVLAFFLLGFFPSFVGSYSSARIDKGYKIMFILAILIIVSVGIVIFQILSCL